MTPKPGTKADAVFGALQDLPVGKSAFFFFTAGRAICWWTLNHERFTVNGELNTDDPGMMESMVHLQYWQQPDMKELRDIVRSFESHSERIFSITTKRIYSRMVRVQRSV